jgi:cytochrome o ubiquinol oxidase subunit 3
MTKARGAAPAAGPASVEITVAYGFWIFLLSDIVMFSAVFAAYAVLAPQTAGGPTGHSLFDLRNVGIETLSLLFSSFTCGVAVLAAENRRMATFYVGMALTFALGALFLGMEISEFARMIGEGAGPARSAFLSAFFSLIGLHGAHITIGLLWLCFLVAQTLVKGPQAFVLRRLGCFGLFWHALDIVWVALLSLVYLMGAR